MIVKSTMFNTDNLFLNILTVQFNLTLFISIYWEARLAAQGQLLHQ
jgi:hypothetical protein